MNTYGCERESYMVASYDIVAAPSMGGIEHGGDMVTTCEWTPTPYEDFCANHVSTMQTMVGYC